METRDIQKLDKSLVWQTTHTCKDTRAALKKLQMMGYRYGWKEVKDDSLFGGYYVDKDGNCYRVA